jgi:hypothetical protein
MRSLPVKAIICFPTAHLPSVSKFVKQFDLRVLFGSIHIQCSPDTLLQDKHAKNLAEKLAARLGRCESERQWNDTAYALSLLQHKNEEILKKVQEGFRLVQATA